MPETESPELRNIKGAVEFNLAVLNKILPEPRTLRERVDGLTPEGRLRLAAKVGMENLIRVMIARREV